MKSPYIIIILCIFGYISNAEEGQSIIYDLQYSSEYEVNVKEFSEGYIPKNTKLYFRVKINPSDKSGVTFKVIQSEFSYFGPLNIYGFSEKPSDEETKQGYGISQKIETDWFHKSEIYRLGIYPFKEFNNTNINYVVINFVPTQNLTYLTILVSVYKNKKNMIRRKISYNEEYEIDSDTLINANTHYYLYLESKNKDNEAVSIKVYKKDFIPTFTVSVVGMRNKSLFPATIDRLDSRFLSNYDSNITDSKYVTYKYEYSRIKDSVTYQYVVIQSEYSFEYMSICVGDNCGSSFSVLLIILIVLIGLVVVGIVAFLVLRKLGYIKLGKVTSSDI